MTEGLVPSIILIFATMKKTYVVRDGKVVEVTDEPIEIENQPFYIHVKGSGGIKWLNKSANKTWINNGKVYKAKEGNSTNLK